MSEQVIKSLQTLISEALEERRGIVVYSRLEPVEMDRMARRVERETMEKLRSALPEETIDQRVLDVRERLARMEGDLAVLGEVGDIREASRQLQTDEIIWQAFEDIAWMLGFNEARRG